MQFKSIVCALALCSVLFGNEEPDSEILSEPEIPGAFPLLFSSAPGGQNILVVDSDDDKPVETIARREFSRLAASTTG